MVKNPSANAADARDTGFDPWVGKIPWRRKWHPTTSILAWEIPWAEETGRLQSMGLQRDTSEHMAAFCFSRTCTNCCCTSFLQGLSPEDSPETPTASPLTPSVLSCRPSSDPEAQEAFLDCQIYPQSSLSTWGITGQSRAHWGLRFSQAEPSRDRVGPQSMPPDLALSLLDKSCRVYNPLTFPPRGDSPDFPVGQVAKTPHFQSREPRFNPCSGN